MTKRHRPMRQIPAWRSPVARAVAKQAMASAARNERIATLILEQDEPATEHLAHMAWVIGAGCETAIHALGLHHPISRTLHGALRSIEAMCLRHAYTWQTEHALAIEAALASAHQVIVEHPEIAQHHTDAGDVIAATIRAQRLAPGMVAGVEIYQQTAEA